VFTLALARLSCPQYIGQTDRQMVLASSVPISTYVRLTIATQLIIPFPLQHIQKCDFQYHHHQHRETPQIPKYTSNYHKKEDGKRINKKS